MDASSLNQPVEIKNAGQKVIYLIRKAFLEGTLSSTNNPTEEVQFILNKPTTINPDLYKEDPLEKAFLENLIQLIESGQIKLFTPSTLLNQAVYQKSSPEIQAKADYDILTLLYKIRQIKSLWDKDEKQSYQIMNLVNSLRLAKESLESAQGDIFII